MNEKKAKQIFRYAGAVSVCIMYLMFWFNKGFYLPTDPETKLSMSRIIFVTIMAAGGVALSLLKFELPEKINRISAWILFFLTPIFSFFALEYANIHTSRILWQVVTGLGIVRCLATLFVLFIFLLGIYLISNSLKVSSLIVSISVCIFGTVCYFVYFFRGIPFLASDLTTIGTALNVMSDYQYELNYQTFVLILLTLIWCIGNCRLKNVKGPNWKIRVSAAICYILLIFVSFNMLINTNILRSRLKVTVNTFRPEKSYGRQGAILTVMRSLQLIMIEKPDGYHVQEAAALAEPYYEVVETDTINPNLIIIMDEAFVDLQSMADFSTNKEVIPFFNSLKENTVRGEMYVSVFGGQTANTEFEVLTGNSKAFLPASTTPYQLFIKKEFPSLTYTLQRRGYQGNIALHPYWPNGYNRSTVYPLLGFDEFIAIEDFENPKLIRDYISDEEDFDRVISEYEKAKAKSNAPFYLFNVTMQNHSGYDKDFDNLSTDIKITDEEFQNEQAERYLNLIHISDQAFEQLVSYFEQVDEPTAIVFFGDHEPGIQEKFYNKIFGKSVKKLKDEELIEKYKVPYVIWANYDIEERENVTTSANFLSSLILQSTNMEMTPYARFLMEISKEITALTAYGYFGADGKFYSLDDDTSPYWDTLKRYEVIQYNNMADSNNRLENFFD